MQTSKSPSLSKSSLSVLASALLLSCLGFGCNGDSTTAASNTSSSSTAALTTATLSASFSLSTIAPGASGQVTVQGGQAPYTFTVASGTGTIDTYGVFTAPTAAGYSVVTVTDSAAASTTVYIQIGSTISVTSTRTTLAAGDTATLSTTGGTAPYTYTLTSGKGSMASNVFTASPTAGAETDEIEVNDSTGAHVTLSLTITGISALGVTPANSTVGTEVVVSLQTSGGKAPYTFAISQGLGTLVGNSFISPSTAGTTYIRVSDSSGQVTLAVVKTTILSTSSATLDQSTTAIADSYLATSFTGGTSSQLPELIFFGTGSTMTPDSIAANASYCLVGGQVGAPCGITIPLTNYDATLAKTNYYKGTVTIIGRDQTAEFDFCLRPQDSNRIYLKWYTTNHSPLTQSYSTSGMTFLSGLLLRAEFVPVDTVSTSAGAVSIQLHGAGFISTNLCGTGFTTTNYVQGGN